MIDTLLLKLRSKGLWVGLSSVVVMYLANTWFYEKLGITQDSLKITLNTIFTILGNVGVFNNPNKSMTKY